jgi:hypothetical protein
MWHSRPRLWPFRSVSSAVEFCFFLIRVYPRRSAVRFFAFPITRDVPITGSPDLEPRSFVSSVVKVLAFPYPTRLFRHFCCKQRHFRKSSLAPRLGGPCVALGWPKGDPSVTQSQTQSQAGRGSQPFTKYQIPRTKYQLLASCSVFKELRGHLTLGRCRTIAVLFARINCESGHILGQSAAP